MNFYLSLIIGFANIQKYVFTFREIEREWETLGIEFIEYRSVSFSLALYATRWWSSTCQYYFCSVIFIIALGATFLRRIPIYENKLKYPKVHNRKNVCCYSCWMQLILSAIACARLWICHFRCWFSLSVYSLHQWGDWAWAHMSTFEHWQFIRLELKTTDAYFTRSTKQSVLEDEHRTTDHTDRVCCLQILFFLFCFCCILNVCFALIYCFGRSYSATIQTIGHRTTRAWLIRL